MTKAQTQASPADIQGHPTHEEIARRAQELFLRRGATDGNEQEDWFQAERELIEEPNWLEEMTCAQRAHAVSWEHPWSAEVNPAEDEEVFAAFKASLEACNAEDPQNQLDEPVGAGSDPLKG